MTSVMVANNWLFTNCFLDVHIIAPKPRYLFTKHVKNFGKKVKSFLRFDHTHICALLELLDNKESKK